MSTRDSYRDAGVDIDVANEMKRGFIPLLEKRSATLNRPHAFAAIIDAGLRRYQDPVLVLKSEEPGSKQLIAFEENQIESVCADMINHLVNDCITCGATPVAIQDVVICGKLEPLIVQRIVSAISNSAKDQGCFLSGGETSEQPGVLADGRYVLSSSIVGVIERSRIVDGNSIGENDVVIGLRSSGLHTNGFSLVRHLMAKEPMLRARRIGGRSFIDAALDVHAPYYVCLKPLFDSELVKGAAHITGGGIRENLNRIVPADIDAVIDLSSYRPQKIFSVLRLAGNISDDEMLRAFNLGVGMTIVISADNAPRAIDMLRAGNCEAWLIGKTVSGTGKVICTNTIPWDLEGP
jgi:phosphoribosylformylglycinamidine cyclo-ligase